MSVVEPTLAGSSPAAESGTGQDFASTQTEGASPSPESPAGVNGGGQRQSEHVPYDRFQEVNQQLQAVRSWIGQMGYSNFEDYQRDADRQWEEQQSGYEGSAYDRADPSASAFDANDPAQVAQQRIDRLEALATQQLFDKRFGELSQQFPRADKDEVYKELVLGQGRVNVEQAVQRSHEAREAYRQKVLQEHLESSKRRSEGAVEGAGGELGLGGAVDWSKVPAGDFRKHFKDFEKKHGLA